MVLYRNRLHREGCRRYCNKFEWYCCNNSGHCRCHRAPVFQYMISGRSCDLHRKIRQLHSRHHRRAHLCPCLRSLQHTACRCRADWRRNRFATRRRLRVRPDNFERNDHAKAGKSGLPRSTPRRMLGDCQRMRLRRRCRHRRRADRLCSTFLRRWCSNRFDTSRQHRKRPLRPCNCLWYRRQLPPCMCRPHRSHHPGSPTPSSIDH